MSHLSDIVRFFSALCSGNVDACTGKKYPSRSVFASTICNLSINFVNLKFPSSYPRSEGFLIALAHEVTHRQNGCSECFLNLHLGASPNLLRIPQLSLSFLKNLCIISMYPKYPKASADVPN